MAVHARVRSYTGEGDAAEAAGVVLNSQIVSVVFFRLYSIGLPVLRNSNRIGSN